MFLFFFNSICCIINYLLSLTDFSLLRSLLGGGGEVLLSSSMDLGIWLGWHLVSGASSDEY